MNNLKKIFGSKIKIIEETKDKLIIDYGAISGEGSMTIYSIMPGFILSFIDFNTESSLHNERGTKNVWEINYCIKGRFECEFKDNTFAYVGEGDLAVNSMENLPVASGFPLKLYYGIGIYIYVDEIKKSLSEVLKLLSINLNKIYENFNLKSECYISKAAPKIKHIFTEIYENRECIDSEYIKIKLIELLYFFNTMNKDLICEERYYTKNQVDKVKHIRDHMIEHDDTRFSLEELAREHYISLSLFKSCFKKVYGDTPYAYLRKYKMNKAAKLIKADKLNINEIAITLGYKNASKFSKAFKDVMGILPSEYKKQNI